LQFSIEVEDYLIREQIKCLSHNVVKIVESSRGKGKVKSCKLVYIAETAITGFNEMWFLGAESLLIEAPIQKKKVKVKKSIQSKQIK